MAHVKWHNFITVLHTFVDGNKSGKVIKIKNVFYSPSSMSCFTYGS